MLAIGYYRAFHLQVNGAIERVFFIASIVAVFAVIAGFAHLWKRFADIPET